MSLQAIVRAFVLADNAAQSHKIAYNEEAIVWPLQTDSWLSENPQTHAAVQRCMHPSDKTELTFSGKVLCLMLSWDSGPAQRSVMEHHRQEGHAPRG